MLDKSCESRLLFCRPIHDCPCYDDKRYANKLVANVISKKFKWHRYLADPQCSKPWVGNSRNLSPTFCMTF